MTLPVAASQTIRRGQLLVASSGRLQQAISDALTPGQAIRSGNLSAQTLFVAMEDKSTGASPGEADTMMAAPLKGCGNQVLLQAANFPASAGALGSPANTTAAALNAETAYAIGLINNGGELQYGLDISTTNGCLKIKEDWPGNQAADTYARFWCGQD